MNSPTLDLIPATASDRWTEVLAQTDGYDFYHLPEYHLLAEERGEGNATLFAYRDSSKVIAWPFLLRAIDQVEGLEQSAGGLRDATSTYGYSGPLFSKTAREDAEFAKEFSASLIRVAKDLHLISFFSRTHPLLNRVLPDLGIGMFIQVGETVSIDLSESEEAQWSQMRRDHRKNIKMSRDGGVRVWRDLGWSRFNDFVRLYRTTMERVGATEYYFFDHGYFARLRDVLGERLQLFIAEFEGEICSASLAVQTGPIIQYHLSASNPKYKKLAPSKLIIDEMRLWGKAMGGSVLHLGGGVGSKADSLFEFKAGFSPIRHPFRIWQCIVEPEIYRSLAELRRKHIEVGAGAELQNDFFPLYRAGAILPPFQVKNSPGDG